MAHSGPVNVWPPLTYEATDWAPGGGLSTLADGIGVVLADRTSHSLGQGNPRVPGSDEILAILDAFAARAGRHSLSD